MELELTEIRICLSRVEALLHVLAVKAHAELLMTEVGMRGAPKTLEAQIATQAVRHAEAEAATLLQEVRESRGAGRDEREERDNGEAKTKEDGSRESGGGKGA